MSSLTRRVLVIYFAPAGRQYNQTFLSLINIFDFDTGFEVDKFNFAEISDDNAAELAKLISQVDCIYLHYSLLYQRVRPNILAFFKHLKPLRKSSAFKIAMPQDEGNYPGVLDDLFVYFKIDLLMSVHYSDAGPIYPNARKTLKIEQVLPAFIEKDWVKSQPPIKNIDSRPIGLGYRGRASIWRHGKANYYKSEFAEELSNRLEKEDWLTDVSLFSDDRIYGSDWQKFIQDSRLVYGAPGGYTAIDYYGELSIKVNEVIKQSNPKSFYEFNELMHSGWDDSELLTITARHFEAAYYGTPQILFESSYKGLLTAEKHYVPISPNCANFEKILPLLSDWRLSARMFLRRSTRTKHYDKDW